MRFALISYSSVFFFTLGLRLVINQFDLRLLKLLLVFVVIAGLLSLIFIRESLQNRILISVVWTSLIGIGFRVGKRVLVKSTEG